MFDSAGKCPRKESLGRCNDEIAEGRVASVESFVYRGLGRGLEDVVAPFAKGPVEEVAGIMRDGGRILLFDLVASLLSKACGKLSLAVKLEISVCAAWRDLLAESRLERFGVVNSEMESEVIPTNAPFLLGRDGVVKAPVAR